MARGINKVILVGNLGNDPEVKYTQSGMAVTIVRLATTSVRKDRDGNNQERTEWHRVVFFGKLGEIAGEYLRKGSQVYVEGEIRYYGARAIGGTAALRDLTEIRLLRLNGHDYWRLKTRGGEALLVPVEAKGADRLADAFTALPGLDLGRVSAALAQKGGPSLRIVWTAPNSATRSG